MKREQLGSRLGFIMLSAGCAIGCGNVWKFPWMCGQNGGGSFMLVYIICLIILGIPALTMEFSIGRAAQSSPLYMYQKLEKPGQKWGIFGWGWDNFIKETNTGIGPKVQAWQKPIFKYVVPVIIIAIYIYGIVTFNWR